MTKVFTVARLITAAILIPLLLASPLAAQASKNSRNTSTAIID